MRIRGLLACLLVLLPGLASAQTPTPWPINTAIRLAFDDPNTPLPPGHEIKYRFYVNGQANDQIVFGAPVGGVVEFNFPGFPSVGQRTLGVTVRYQPVAGSGLVCGSTINCTESVPATLAISVVDVTAPKPPAGLRIVITPQAANNKIVGVQVAITSDDGASIVDEFVSVAQFTGRLTLLTPTVIQR